MLGQYGEGGIFYSTEANNFDCCYYNLDNWTEIKNWIGGDGSQMWEINKQFLLNNKNKTFYMSHNPDLAIDFFRQEIDLIESWDGFIRFDKEGKYWKAIFE